jgi:hypothetical protein
VARDGGNIAGAFADGAKDVEFDGCFESRGALMGLDHVKDKAWVRRSFSWVNGLHATSLGLRWGCFVGE